MLILVFLAAASFAAQNTNEAATTVQATATECIFSKAPSYLDDDDVLGNATKIWEACDPGLPSLLSCDILKKLNLNEQLGECEDQNKAFLADRKRWGLNTAIRAIELHRRKRDGTL